MRLLGKGNGAPNAGEGGGRDLEPPLQPQPALPRGPPVCLHYSSGSGLVSPGLFGPVLFLVPLPDCFLLLCLLSSRSPWLQRAQVIAPLQLAALPMCSLSCDCVVETIS